MAHTCVRREKLRDGNQPLGDVFLNKQVFLKLTFCLFPHKQLSKYWCQPLCWPSRFLHFFPSMDRIETKSGRGRRVGEGSWSRIPAPFSRKSRITLFFSSLFRIPAFASKNNNNNNNNRKKNRASVWFAFAAAQAYDFPNSRHTGKKSPVSLKFSECFLVFTKRSA